MLKDEGKLRLKEYGKNKIYFLDQSILGKQMSDHEIAKKRNKIDKMKNNNAQKKTECGEIGLLIY